MERYFGSYQKIEPSSKKEGALLLSADNIIGDSYEIIFDGDLAWAKNRLWCTGRPFYHRFLPTASRLERSRVEIHRAALPRRVHTRARTRHLLGRNGCALPRTPI